MSVFYLRAAAGALRAGDRTAAADHVREVWLETGHPRVWALCSKLGGLPPAMEPVRALTEEEEAHVDHLLAWMRAGLEPGGPSAASRAAPEARPESMHNPGTQAYLSAIAKAPEDDELRLVFADWLTNLGDPRGEFINLQYARLEQEPTPEARAREEALLRDYRAQWIAPLGKWLTLGVRFERGFLHTARFRQSAPPRDLQTLHHPRWTTVVRLIRPPADLLAAGALYSLTDVELWQDAAAKLCRTGCHSKIERLTVERRQERFAPRFQEAFTEPALPHLRHLRMQGKVARHPFNMRWLLVAPLARQLETLTVRVRGSDWSISDWSRELAATQPKLSALVLEHDGGRLELTRGPRGQWDALEVHLEGPRKARTALEAQVEKRRG